MARLRSRGGRARPRCSFVVWCDVLAFPQKPAILTDGRGKDEQACCRRVDVAAHQPAIEAHALVQEVALERDCLLVRTVTASVPVRVDYTLTELGRDLERQIRPLKDWAEMNMNAVLASRRRYDTVAGEPRYDRG